MHEGDQASNSEDDRQPPQLLVAAALTGIQGLATTLLAIAEAVNVSGQRLVMGVTTALFFAAFGIGLMVAAYGVYGRRPWSRGPVLFAQLIWLGLAWSFREGHTLALSIPLAISAVIVLAGLLHPASVAALDRPEHRGESR